MAGASLPLEVVGDIMRFVGAPPPVTLFLTDARERYGLIKSITATPAHYIVEKKAPTPPPAFGRLTLKKDVYRSHDEREVWPRSDETAALAKAMVRVWLASEHPFTLKVKRGIIEHSTSVFELEFDGNFETWYGGGRDYDDDEFKTEGNHLMELPDKPLPKHFLRLQELYNQKRERQLAKARLIADVFFSAPTHY